jgi:hypothetical protein
MASSHQIVVYRMCHQATTADATRVAIKIQFSMELERVTFVSDKTLFGAVFAASRPACGVFSISAPCDLEENAFPSK